MSWLNALLAGIGGGIEGDALAREKRQLEQERQLEREQRQAQLEREFKFRQDQTAYGRDRDALMDARYNYGQETGPIDPSNAAIYDKYNLPMAKALEEVKGRGVGAVTIPNIPGYRLPEMPTELPSEAPDLIENAPTPMVSPVAGATLGGVKDTFSKPETQEDALKRVALSQLEIALQNAKTPEEKKAIAAMLSGFTLPSTRTTPVGTTSGADLIGMTDSFGKEITAADGNKRYSVRRSGDGKEEYVPLAPLASAGKPTYRSMAGPNGAPAIYAIYPDGRDPEFVGYQSDKNQNILYVDSDGNQRVVSMPPVYGGGRPQEVSGEAPTKTETPAVFTPPPSAGVNRGTVLGKTQTPAAMRTAVAELQSVRDMANAAMEAGEAVKWGGVGGLGQGRVHEWLYKELGAGNPEEAKLRNILNNLFGDIAKERGGAALTPAEITILKSYLPTPNMSVPQIKTNLKGIQDMLNRKLANLDGGQPVEAPAAQPGYEVVVGPDGVGRVQKKQGGG